MLDINDFKENLAQFECLRIRDARTVWLNDAETTELEKLLGKNLSKSGFARQFAYISNTNRCFAEGQLDEHDSRVYMAERYGGRGVGTNGGGGRAGNLGQFQIKGMGPNLLAHAESVWHSYGSLNLVDAAYEAIYSTVLEKILPIGCARIYGLIHTSGTGALQLYNWGTKQAELIAASGALLVRERVMRPAHFMHAELFSPPKATLLKRESVRIRSMYRQLKTRFGTDDQFVQFVGRFILASAKQFAFARAARIAHGGLSPSNICLDGRWIDLTEARFLSGGKNFRGASTFFDEPQVVVESFRQLLYIYGKCNCTQFNIDPLIKYFEKVFGNCFSYYSLSILGLPEGHLDKIAESEDGKVYAAAYATVLLKSKVPVSDVPERHDPCDPVIAFIRFSYLALGGSEIASSKFSELLQITHVRAQEVLTRFRNLLRASALQRHEPFNSSKFRNCCIAYAIKALRWAYLSAYFYRGRIMPQLYSLVNENDLDGLSLYIQNCIDQSKWIFDTASTGRIVIAKIGEMEIAYDETLHLYSLTGSCNYTFECYKACLAFVAGNYPDLQLSGEFDLTFYLQGIAEVLASIEDMPKISISVHNPNATAK